MPINRLLIDSKLEPEVVERLDAAYSYALRSLSLVDRNDPLTELLARMIIEAGATAADPRDISETAVKKIFG